MATPSQSRSSGKGEDDNFEWCQTIERRQLANERQLKALLQETERLREENVVLRIQAQHQGLFDEPFPETCNVRPHEPHTPMPRAPREESSDSTHFSAKKQRDRRPQLSNSMRARLGPPEPGRSRPPVATTWTPRPDPMVSPMVQNVPPHRDPMVTPTMRNVHSHPAIQQAGGNLPNEPPIGSISRRLDDMLSTPFYSHIIHYEPPRDSSYQSFPYTMEPTIPSITSCTIDSFMTLDIGNDALLCKGPVRSFRGQYLCSARHKQNISTLQNIKMQDKESLREFVSGWPSRTSSRGLQHGCCPIDLQAKQLGAARKGIPNLQTSQDHPTGGRKGQGLSDFKWPRPIETDPSTRDRSRRCAFHKDHGHTTETCRALQYLVERLIKAGHLKQYLRSDTRGRDVPQHHNPGAPRAPAAPKVVINYINGGPSDEEYDSRRKRQKLLRAASIRERINSIRPGLTGEGPRPIDGTIIFPLVDPTRTLQPHRDALILSLEIGTSMCGVSWLTQATRPILYKHRSLATMGHRLTGLENPGRILSGGSTDRQPHPWRHYTAGRTWLHYMKAIPSTYHQMHEEQEPAKRKDFPLGPVIHVINSNYWVRRTKTPGSRSLTNNPNFGRKYSPHERQFPHDVRRNADHTKRPQTKHDIFAWTHSDMKGIHPSIVSHKLNVFSTARPVRQKIRRFHPDRQNVIRSEIDKLLEPDSSEKYIIRIVGKRSNGTQKRRKMASLCRLHQFNNACPKDSFPLPRIDQIVDSTSGQGMPSFLDTFSGYHQILMSPDDEERQLHNATRPLLLQSHAIRTQKCWRHLSKIDD
ncbi:hypothetical protein CK203_021792 [Vitis vinifera]|uniref:Transposon Ty3-I Gag-Pol polyprotein n=1 Tax=Vitis vinifera TaxID=29760 RepID=A0A438J4Y5_VITVI|nr:hypothetical protein CK203_021792 [Vitis vinifera]